MKGGQSAGCAMVSSHSILEMRKLGCRGVQPLTQSYTVGSEPIPGGQAKEAGLPAGPAVRDLGHVAPRISHSCGTDAHWRPPGLRFWSRGPAVATQAPWPAPGMTLALPCSDRPSSPAGAGAEAHGPDGGGEPAEGLRQRPHLPHQLHLRQQRLRDLHVGGRPAHQPLAPGCHRPELQYPFPPPPCAASRGRSGFWVRAAGVVVSRPTWGRCSVRLWRVPCGSCYANESQLRDQHSSRVADVPIILGPYQG